MREIPTSRFCILWARLNFLFSIFSELFFTRNYQLPYELTISVQKGKTTTFGALYLNLDISSYDSLLILIPQKTGNKIFKILEIFHDIKNDPRIMNWVLSKPVSLAIFGGVVWIIRYDEGYSSLVEWLEIIAKVSENSTEKAENSNNQSHLSSLLPTTSFLPTLPIMLDGSYVTPTVIPPPPNPLR